MTCILASLLLATVASATNAGEEYEMLPDPQIASLKLGFQGAYRLGCWTDSTVEIVGAEQDFSGTVEVLSPDSDGVAATSRTLFSMKAEYDADVVVPLRLGQEAGAITVRVVDEQGAERARRTFYPGRAADAGGFPTGLPATARLVVTFGATTDLAAGLAHADNEATPGADVYSVLLQDAALLPTTWYGYESVDAVILSGADLKAYAAADALAPRIAALNRWVELGGRLVIFCGADSAELLAEGAPLAPLLPGRYSGEIVPLPDEASLEAFAGAAGHIFRAAVKDRLRVPRVVESQGRVLAQGPAATPLVLRTRRGFGEVTFVAVDPESREIAGWEDRTNFLRQCLRWPAPAPNSSRDRGGPPAADMVNHLRSALDQHFQGVSTASFGLVAILTLGFIAVIGPASYFLVRALNRPNLAWLTFPIAVVATSAGAYSLSYRMKGTERVINQVEIVDVDVTTGLARGTVWSHEFNPEVERYGVAFKPRFGKKSVETPESLVAPLGVPGFGLGGMQGQRAMPPLFDAGYAYGGDLASLDRYPIEQWSTRTLAARWSGTVGATLDASLRPRGDDELAGELTNRTGVTLRDCVLIRGNWAYALPPLADGASYKLTVDSKPRTLRTTLTSLAAGDDPHARTADDGSVPFDPLSTDVARIAKLMMFYDAMGGAAYAGTPNRYQGFIDMSRLLASNDAILLARAPNYFFGIADEDKPNSFSGSSWTMRPSAAPSGAFHLDINPNDKQWTYYRFIIPLEEPSADSAVDERPQEEAEPLLGPQPFGR